ncbi:MAG: hypothetical protein ACLQKA_10195 [Bryobacteraceae bacterium]
MSAAQRALSIVAGAAALWAQSQPAQQPALQRTPQAQPAQPMIRQPLPQQPAPQPARQPVQQPAPQPAGLLNPWEIAPVLDEISAHGVRMAEALGRIDVRPWIQRGASETYLDQWQSATVQARALADTAGAMSHNPEKLSAGLEVLFRIQALETMTGSLEQAMRKYQTPAGAAAMVALSAENDANRLRLERYLVSLAADLERRVQVMDSEAQRCRAVLVAPSKPSKKR